MIPAIYLLGIVDANRRLLSCMGYQNGPMLIQIGSTVIHIFWCWLFVDYLGYEMKGTAMATCVTNILNLIVLHFYTIRCTDDRVTKEAYKLPTRESFDLKGLKEYMTLGLPSIGMICLEWWSFEIMTLYSALIGLVATAT